MTIYVNKESFYELLFSKKYIQINDMSTINTNIADYLRQIETLTNTNLQILKSLNDSFYTKKNHLLAEVDDTTYVIPSFISLENKINMLQENFENLVKAPETCEAYFNFDNNTRAIEVRKYSHVPDSIKLPTVSTYDFESNDIFKDFMTPVPYINLELPYLPNDIVEVNVKKIVPKSDALKEIFKSRLSYTSEVTDIDGNVTAQTLYNQSVNATYGDINKLLINYIEDTDYVEYDTIYKLPVRKNIGTAKYVIESVVSDVIDDDLNEIVTLKLRTDLKDNAYTNKLMYKLFDDTIEKSLKVGDMLINYDGTGKVQIIEVKPATNTIVVKIVNGEYLNFIGTDSYDTNNDTDIHDFSKLRFYDSIDFDADKFIKVPLEEDRYVFVAAAALNSRMNVQSSWGTGILIDVHSLKNNDVAFKKYYDANVKNIGDVLFEMTSMVTAPITALSQDNFNEFVSLKPILSNDTMSVMQINKHLNNSDTVQNIRDAYNQKKLAQSELDEVQTKINDINAQLASISFNDTTGIRSVHTAQLTKLNNQKNELLATINNAIDSISLSVNASEIPIENAKYRIRGFYIPNLSNVGSIITNDHVIGIKVQYRYKNMSTALGTATSMTGLNGETYIYSDWNNMNSFNKAKIAKCVDGVYTYAYEDRNENKNEPSYNQIDIPISQGESVDVRIKVIYDFGQPYISVTSDWSDIINIKFPDEFAKDVPVLTIIEENNNDIETNRFNTILTNNGIDDHIKDLIMDQNTIYYHKPDNIASGFYTEERRVIPLKDKLVSMSNDIATLKSEITGSSDNCRVYISIGDNSIVLHPDRENVITLEPYNNFSIRNTYGNSAGIGSWDIDNLFNTSTTNSSDGAYLVQDGIVSTMINITITNGGDTAMKLYSLFPGNRNIKLNSTSSTYVKKDGYCFSKDGKENGVWFRYQHGSEVNKLQTQNQYITFRVKDAWTGEQYYYPNVGNSIDNQQNSRVLPTISSSDKLGMIIYPYVSTKHGLCIDSDDPKAYMTVHPGDEIVVPMLCSFVASKSNSTIKKTISFDLRPSLYSDPINYTFTVVAKNTTTMQDKLTIANNKTFWDRLRNPIKYFTNIR